MVCLVSYIFMFSLSCFDKTSPTKWPKETPLWGTWSWLWMMPRVPAVKWRRVKCQSTQSDAQNMEVKIHSLPPKKYSLVTRGTPRGMVFIHMNLMASQLALNKASLERWKVLVVGFPYTPSFVGVKSRLRLSNIVALSCISPVILAEEHGKKERPECL